MSEETGREKRFDILRNSADLYGTVYQIVSILAAHQISRSSLGSFQSEYVSQLAAKVLPHLPVPDDKANVW